jgi:NAD(P)H-flavin reductase
MASAVLSARHDAGGGLLLVSLELAPEIAGAYTAPGQYVEVKTASGNGYFVVASDVGVVRWQLLVKNAGGASEVLATTPLGTVLELDGPLGAGFSVERMTDRHVVVAVVGSALGVARPVLHRRIGDGVARATHLFLGLRSLADLPMAGEIEAWVREGVLVVLCLSRSELHHHPEVLPGVPRATGYVQHALARALESGEVPHGTLVIAAGPDELLADVRLLADLRRRTEGVGEAFLAGPRIEVLTNV